MIWTLPSILESVSQLLFSSSCSAERNRVIGILNHFFQPRVLNSEEDDGDDSRSLDSWELKDPEMATTWTTLWAPHTSHLVFATSFRGDVNDPQHLDFETKITDFDDESSNLIKIFCSSTRPDPYHFTIVIDTIRSPYSIVDCYESLLASHFDDIVRTIEEEISERKWMTAKGEALRAKPLAKKLRSIVSAMEVATVVQKSKSTSTRRRGDASAVTGTGSQVHSQASARPRSSAPTPSRSTPRITRSATATPSTRHSPAKKPETSTRKRSKLVSEEDLSTSLASAISELPVPHRSGEVIDYNNVNLIFQKFFTDCQDAFVFDDPRQKTELDVMRLHNAPAEWTIRAFEQRGMEDLKTYLMNMPDRSQKQTLCVMPKLDFKPKDLDEMADCDFYIINGQHSVAASKSMIEGNVPETIRKDFRTWNCFIVWTKDQDKLRKISAFYNRVNHLTPFKPTWATNILASRAVWVKYGRPIPKHVAAGVTDARTGARRPPGNDKQFEV